MSYGPPDYSQGAGEELFRHDAAPCDVKSALECRPVRVEV